jgi:hypothetical protein
VRKEVVMGLEWSICMPDVKAALSVAATLKLKLRLGVFAHVDQLLHAAPAPRSSSMKKPMYGPHILGIELTT